MKIMVLLLIALMMLGCAGEKKDEGTDQQVDLKPQIAVFKDEEVWKAQVTFTLPNPCHKIEFLGKDESDSQIILKFKHDHPDPETTCAQVIEIYNETVSLGSLDKGNYTVLVLVDGQEAKRIDVSI